MGTGAGRLHPGAQCWQGGGSLGPHQWVTAFPSRGEQGWWAPPVLLCNPEHRSELAVSAPGASASCDAWCTAWPLYPKGSEGLSAPPKSAGPKAAGSFWLLKALGEQGHCPQGHLTLDNLTGDAGPWGSVTRESGRV